MLELFDQSQDSSALDGKQEAVLLNQQDILEGESDINGQSIVFEREESQSEIQLKSREEFKIEQQVDQPILNFYNAENHLMINDYQSGPCNSSSDIEISSSVKRQLMGQEDSSKSGVVIRQEVNEMAYEFADSANESHSQLIDANVTANLLLKLEE